MVFFSIIITLFANYGDISYELYKNSESSKKYYNSVLSFNIIFYTRSISSY